MPDFISPVCSPPHTRLPAQQMWFSSLAVTGQQWAWHWGLFLNSIISCPAAYSSCNQLPDLGVHLILHASHPLHQVFSVRCSCDWLAFPPPPVWFSSPWGRSLCHLCYVGPFLARESFIFLFISWSFPLLLLPLSWFELWIIHVFPWFCHSFFLPHESNSRDTVYFLTSSLSGLLTGTGFIPVGHE